MNRNRQVLLGAFFLVVFGLLGWYTLFLTDFTLFGKKFELVVHFPEANGLRPGDSVLVAGIRQGRVKGMTLDADAPLESRVTISLLLDEVLPLKEGFTIQIKDATLLGGRNVVIDPGLPGAAMVPDGTALFGTIGRDPLAALGNLVDENREAVQRAIDNFNGLITEARTGPGTVAKVLNDPAFADKLDQSVTQIQATFDNAAAITQEVRDGQGFLGRLIKDEELYGKVQEIATSLKEVGDNLAVTTRDIREGNGVLARLVKDEALANELDAAVKNLRAITDKINNGEGTLGRLVTDPAVFDDIKELVAKAKNGEGTLGALFTKEELYDKLNQVADDLLAASDAIANAKGSLGKVIMTPELYDEVRKALAVVTRALEEYREAAPVTTFTSVLFGAF